MFALFSIIIENNPLFSVQQFTNSKLQIYDNQLYGIHIYESCTYIFLYFEKWTLSLFCNNAVLLKKRRKMHIRKSWWRRSKEQCSVVLLTREPGSRPWQRWQQQCLVIICSMLGGGTNIQWSMLVGACRLRPDRIITTTTVIFLPRDSIFPLYKYILYFISMYIYSYSVAVNICPHLHFHVFHKKKKERKMVVNSEKTLISNTSKSWSYYLLER